MPTRRELLALTPVAALVSVRALAREVAAPSDVNATEDLMREHGVVRRVLIVYEESVGRFGKGHDPVEAIAAGAGIVKHFIEAYHEKLEERFVFPRFERHATLGPLVATLRAQHEIGRKLTAAILTEAARPPDTDRAPLLRALGEFRRMYAAHAAREDTDLFPAFHALFTEKQFDALGDQFEDEEHKLLGKGGFEGAVKEVAQIESSLGLSDLAVFSPS
jgi:hemerythrin-like domain-containing protein